MQQDKRHLVTGRIFLRKICLIWPSTDIKCPVGTSVIKGSSNYLAELAIICGRRAVNHAWHSIQSRPVLKDSMPLYVPCLALIDPQCSISVVKQTKRKFEWEFFYYAMTKAPLKLGCGWLFTPSIKLLRCNYLSMLWSNITVSVNGASVYLQAQLIQAILINYDSHQDNKLRIRNFGLGREVIFRGYKRDTIFCRFHIQSVAHLSFDNKMPSGARVINHHKSNYMYIWIYIWISHLET